MAIASVLKDFNLFVDGRGFLGKAEEINPPKLTLKTEELRAGGMDAPLEVDMGMEKLEADFTLVEFDPNVLGLFGVQQGAAVGFTARGSMQNPSTGVAIPVVVSMRGRVKELDMGAWKPGEAARLKCSLMLEYYKFSEAGTDIRSTPKSAVNFRGVEAVHFMATTSP